MLFHPVSGYALVWAELWQPLFGCRARSQALCLRCDPVVCKTERCLLSRWCRQPLQILSGLTRYVSIGYPHRGWLAPGAIEIHTMQACSYSEHCQHLLGEGPSYFPARAGLIYAQMGDRCSLPWQWLTLEELLAIGKSRGPAPCLGAARTAGASLASLI